jgi:hypothetical protein
MTHPTPYPDVNAVLPSHPYLAIIFDMGGVLSIASCPTVTRILSTNHPNSWRQSCAA